MSTYYDKASLFAQIFTAIGTVGAVVTSLWLVQKAQKISVHATLSFKTVYLPSDTDPESYQPTEEIVEVLITNTGIKPFKIYNIGAYDKELKHHFVIMPNYQHAYCTESGHLYSESETGMYVFPPDTFTNSLVDALKISKTDEKKKIISRLKKLHFIATTNLAQNIKIKVDNDFYNDCIKLIKGEN